MRFYEQQVTYRLLTSEGGIGTENLLQAQINGQGNIFVFSDVSYKVNLCNADFFGQLDLSARARTTLTQNFNSPKTNDKIPRLTDIIADVDQILLDTIYLNPNILNPVQHIGETGNLWLQMQVALSAAEVTEFAGGFIEVEISGKMKIFY